MTGRKAPKQTSGEALVARIRTEMDELGVVPTSTEEELLEQAKIIKDRQTDLQEILDEEGLLIDTKSGLKTHPAATEQRMLAGALRQVLGGITIADSVSTPRKNPTKQKAARQRWDRATPGMAGNRREGDAS